MFECCGCGPAPPEEPETTFAATAEYNPADEGSPAKTVETLSAPPADSPPAAGGADAAARIVRNDAALKKHGLPPNAECQEGAPFDAEETAAFADVKALLPDGGACIAKYDETAVVRIHRGMFTNNKGTREERLQETADTFARVHEWKVRVGMDDDAKFFGSPLAAAPAVYAAWPTVLGGEDLYGHVLFTEGLGDVASLVDSGVTVEQVIEVRMRVVEAIERTKATASAAYGARRYKQIYVLDLGQCSLGSLVGRGDVREMTKAIIGLGNEYYPETVSKIFIVNAPFVFRGAYSVASPFIHPVTRDKIRICGGPSKYLPEMESAGIPASCIPAYLGGTHPGRPAGDVVAALGRGAAPKQEAIIVGEVYRVTGMNGATVRVGAALDSKQLTLIAKEALAQVVEAPADADGETPRVRLAEPAGWVSRKVLSSKPAKTACTQ